MLRKTYTEEDTGTAGSACEKSAISAGQQHRVYKRMRDALHAFLSGSAVTAEVPEDLLQDHFKDYKLPVAAMDNDVYVDFLLKVIIKHSINMSSPRCLGHMTALVPDFICEVSDVLLRLNQNLVKSEGSRVLSLVERQTLAMLHRQVFQLSEGFYEFHTHRIGSTLGIMTTGGTLANITALWCARNLAFSTCEGFGGVEKEGMAAALRFYGFERAVIIGSNLMHYSFEKAAGVLGLGSQDVVRVPTNGHHRIGTHTLRSTLARCRDKGWKVIALVGVAGSTDYGSIDPLDELADIAMEHEIHFHVDAAWGTQMLFSKQHRQKLSGIERADTVTLDGHKQLCLPVGIGMTLLRSHSSASVLEKEAHYILRNGSPDLGKYSIEGSRPGTSLLVHAALHTIGAEGFERLLDESIRKARLLAGIVASSPDFELLAQPETNIVSYRYIPYPYRMYVPKLSVQANRSINSCNDKLQGMQYQKGNALVSRTTLTDLPQYPGMSVVALRAVVNNPGTTEEDWMAVLKEQAALAEKQNGDYAN